MTLRQIAAMPTEQLARGLRKGDFRIGRYCRRFIRLEEILVSWFFRLIILGGRCSQSETESLRRCKHRRSRVERALRFGMPYIADCNLNLDTDCLVIGYNHPSLGELPRMLHHFLRSCCNRKAVIAISLHWYEVLRPLLGTLEQMNIILLPTLPDQDFKLLKANLRKSERGNLAAIQAKLHENFAKQVCAIASQDRCVVYVSPSGTRSPHVFKQMMGLKLPCDIEKKPMTNLVRFMGNTKLLKPECDWTFVALAVEPPERFGRGLNLFRDYRLITARYFDKDECIRLAKKSSSEDGDFEYRFMHSIAQMLNTDNRKELAYAAPPRYRSGINI